MPSSLRAFFIVAAVLGTSLLAAAQTNSSFTCQMRATPPPVATFGGPAVAGKGQTELGLGVGAFGDEFGNACDPDLVGGTDWFVRWRCGVGGQTDLGFDALVSANGNNTQSGVAKLAARFQATQGLRLEAGAGAADSGNGRSVNGDLAAVIGTYKHPDDTWNYYASLRLAASHGCFNLFCAGGTGAPGSRAPGAIIPLGTIGAAARVSDTGRFIMEAGLGGLFSRQQPNRDLYIHFALGLQFVVGHDRKQPGSRRGAGT